MNVVIRKVLHTAAFALVASAATAASAATVDCAKPIDRGEMLACQAAEKGVSALRQFIWSRRGVYALYIYDFDSRVAPYASNSQERPTLAKAN